MKYDRPAFPHHLMRTCPDVAVDSARKPSPGSVAVWANDTAPWPSSSASTATNCHT
ncbi:MAG: hypothetical protein IPK32_05035 [Verrucomicrobiaceae bacterium]|nr:hypothetical protein [Verrucomicrobiaceae bacterium]